ncbi:TPA: benzoate/H(+) symporter BenE family transporter [Burkholderia stabilis]|nr:benzoate/H(+) symporter BenE family transporter [Burkholderia stabilis]HDR9649653.1 benzoate/H(+) symporter BenE family transporter [Burkholderia stabilis]HDR9655394.1 benzoate/H(+) symporter BenE family transporter [Burkholderia stabilis]HDR9679719.1 benzoate/H(+) symporter BenE family transporter [Burkholderia stabilis]
MPLRSLRAIFEAENRQEASVITFLATASGMTWLGIGSVAYKELNRVRRPA